MTLMQKAITPALARAHVEGGYDRMAGYVVRAEDVAFATTPAQLFEVHGLGYPGSPFRPDAQFIDLLRFESGPQLQYRDVPGYIGSSCPAKTRRTCSTCRNTYATIWTSCSLIRLKTSLERRSRVWRSGLLR